MVKKYKPGIVVIGGGQAGIHAIEEIRKSDGKIRIYLIDHDKHLFYFRAALKYFVKKHIELPNLNARMDNFIKKNNVTFFQDEVKNIDRDHQFVYTENSLEIPYTKLLIATGGSPFIPPSLRKDVDGIFPMHSLEDTLNICKKADSGIFKKIVILGAGVLGTELAESLIERGVSVSILTRGYVLVPKMLDTKSSAIVVKKYQKLGMDIQFNESISEIHTDESGQVTAITNSKNEKIECDCLCVCTGIRRNIQLAQECNLETDNGIKVNQFLQTSDPNIFAAGDVVEYYVPELKTHKLIDLWGPAGKMGKIAGNNMIRDHITYNLGTFHAYTIFAGLNCHVIGEFNPKNPSEYEILETEYLVRDQVCLFRLILQDNLIKGVFSLGEARHSMILEKIITLKKQIPSNITKSMLLERGFDFERILYYQEH
ncbi:NAD(P)/FAD-dependent oxidoreductase [Candidatus Lokiarchaeum ossiferum]|uniref:NAD(P)/FAD-dependent oxidoreductase n=1 Tax=Candidatus Lokiarchaeum ossiferum TaxID=2951803 RepID=UPI00352D0172